MLPKKNQQCQRQRGFFNLFLVQRIHQDIPNGNALYQHSRSCDTSQALAVWIPLTVFREWKFAWSRHALWLDWTLTSMWANTNKYQYSRKCIGSANSFGRKVKKNVIGRFQKQVNMFLLWRCSQCVAMLHFEPLHKIPDWSAIEFILFKRRHFHTVCAPCSKPIWSKLGTSMWPRGAIGSTSTQDNIIEKRFIIKANSRDGAGRKATWSYIFEYA